MGIIWYTVLNTVMPLGNVLFLKMSKFIFYFMSRMVPEDESYKDKGIHKASEMLWEVAKLLNWVQVYGIDKLFSKANMY